MADAGESETRDRSYSNSFLAESRAVHAKLQLREEELARLREENETLRKQVVVGESYRAECMSLHAKIARLNQELSDLPSYREAAARSDSYKAENVSLQAKLKRLKEELAGAHAELDSQRHVLAERESYKAEAKALEGKLKRAQAEIEAAQQQVHALQPQAESAASYRIEVQELRHLIATLFKQHEHELAPSPKPAIVLAMDEFGSSGPPPLLASTFSLLPEIRYTADEHINHLQRVLASTIAELRQSEKRIVELEVQSKLSGSSRGVSATSVSPDTVPPVPRRRPYEARQAREFVIGDGDFEWVADGGASPVAAAPPSSGSASGSASGSLSGSAAGGGALAAGTAAAIRASSPAPAAVPATAGPLQQPLAPVLKDSALAAENARLQAEVATLTQELERMLDGEESLRAELARLRTEHEQLTAALRTARQQQTSAAGSAAVEVQQLRSQLASLQDECEALRARAAAQEARQRESTAAAERGLALERECDALQSRLRALERERDEWQRTVLAPLQARIESLQAQLSAAEAKAAQATAAAARDSATARDRLRGVLAPLPDTVHSVKRTVRTLRGTVSDALRQLSGDVASLLVSVPRLAQASEVKAARYVALYEKECAARRSLQSKLVAAGGNIRVYCRVRPRAAEEAARDEPIALSVISDTEMVVNMEAGHRKSFDFDRVFDASSTQEEVYRETEPLILCALDGYNVCVFAYGQTGAGKTYTMDGGRDNPGITQRALGTVFSQVQQRSSGAEWLLTVSVMEIYNETIRDLLRTPEDEASRKHEVVVSASGTTVSDISEVTVSTLDEVLQLMDAGRRNRSVASTQMNTDSSRSHSLVVLRILCTDRVTHRQTVGKLTLVDLAGSERVKKSGATGERFEEAKNINASLSALGNVIQALTQKQSHVPFRESKLTYLLQDSLGGNSKTLMFVNIAPTVRNVGETACSLHFAQRVKKVDLGPARRSGDRDVELERLRAQVKQLQGAAGAAAAK